MSQPPQLIEACIASEMQLARHNGRLICFSLSFFLLHFILFSAVVSGFCKTSARERSIMQLGW